MREHCAEKVALENKIVFTGAMGHPCGPHGV